MTFTMVDYIIIGMVALAILIGSIKGFFGMLFGCMSLIIALAGAGFGSVLVAPSLLPTAGSTLVTTMTESVDSKLPDLAVPIYQDGEILYIVKEGEATGTALAEALSGQSGMLGTVLNTVSQPLQSTLISVYGTLTTKSAEVFVAVPTSVATATAAETPLTFNRMLGSLLGYLILVAVGFIVLFIIILILMAVVGRLADKLLEVKALKILDKILGLVMCVAIVGVLVVGVIYVDNRFLGNKLKNGVVEFKDSVIINALSEALSGIVGGSTNTSEVLSRIPTMIRF